MLALELNGQPGRCTSLPPDLAGSVLILPAGECLRGRGPEGLVDVPQPRWRRRPFAAAALRPR
eukprot:496042-Pyramimonas_sp.AAC.1